MKKLIFITCLFFNLFEGGFSQTVKHVSRSDFPKVIELSGEIILEQDYNHHHRIFLLDQYILTMVNSGDNHYHVFDKSSQEYLGAVGVRGEGPNEWEIPQTTNGQFIKVGSEIHLWSFDYLRGNFNLINLSRTLSSKSPYPIIEKNIRINMREFPYFQLFMGSDDVVFGNCWIYEQERVRIKSLDLKTNEISKSGLFPKIKNSNHLPSETMNSLYSGGVDKHPKRDLFVQATLIFNRIDIFDKNLNLVKSFVDGDNWKDFYYDGNEIDPTKNFFVGRVKGYSTLAVSENFIFAVEAPPHEDDNDIEVKESFIRVFDWNGNPKAYLKVGHKITSIEIDEVERMIYATDYDHELVLRFDISDFMNGWL